MPGSRVGPGRHATGQELAIDELDQATRRRRR